VPAGVAWAFSEWCRCVLCRKWQYHNTQNLSIDLQKRNWKFEAGALSKLVGQAYVSPLLFNVEPSTLRGPLAQFQATAFDNEGEDFLGLLSSINSRLPPQQQMSSDILEGTFRKWWPELQEDIKKAAQGKTDETATGYKWLHTMEEVVSIERSADWESVWVINPNPLKSWDLLLSTMLENLQGKTQYDFIIPSDQAQDLSRAINELRGHSGLTKLRIGTIRSDSYKKQAVTHYRVLKRNEHTKVLFEVPIISGDYWVETQGDAIRDFAVRFEEMRENAQYRVPNDRLLSGPSPAAEDARGEADQQDSERRTDLSAREGVH